jgi:hypothetical protein
LFFLHADRPLYVIRIGDRRKLLGRDLDRFAVEARKTIETKLAAPILLFTTKFPMI